MKKEPSWGCQIYKADYGYVIVETVGLDNNVCRDEYHVRDNFRQLTIFLADFFADKAEEPDETEA